MIVNPCRTYSRVKIQPIGLLVALVLAPLTLVLAAEKSSQTVCLNVSTQEERVIELAYESPESPIPCTLYYEKGGERAEVASAKNTQGFCEKKERNLVRTLVASGWQCEHSFSGTTASAAPKASLVLNLFDQNQQTMDSAILLDQDEQDSPLLTANEVAEQLKVTLEEQYVADLQSRLAGDFQDALGPEFTVGVTVNLSLDVQIMQIEDIQESENMTQAALPGGDSPSGARDLQPDKALRGESVPARNENDVRGDGAPRTGAADPDHYLLSSVPFSSENEVNRFAAEFHVAYPGVKARISKSSGPNDWRLVIGSAKSKEYLNDGLTQLDVKTRSHFSVLPPTTTDNYDASVYSYVPDDWARFAIAGCYADGYTTTTSLAECSGFLVDVDSFLSCLAGGACAPEYFDDRVPVEAVDLASVIGSDDPVAAARGIFINDIQGCEHISEPSNSDAAECVALSILDDDQRHILECRQRSDTELDFLSCAGSESLSENILLYERCSIDSLAMSECMMAEVNNEYLNSAARCVNYGSTSDILTCAVDSNLDVDESRILTCLSYSSERAGQAECLAREYLDEEQATVLECSRRNDSMSSFGLCVASEQDTFSRSELMAAECLLDDVTGSIDLLDCAGGRFASAELNACIEEEIPLAECFTTDTIMTEVVADTLDDVLAIQTFNDQIELFRSELYAAEGGDLSTVLADEANAQVFAKSEEVAEAVSSKVKKKSGGFLRKLGIGK